MSILIGPSGLLKSAGGVLSGGVAVARKFQTEIILYKNAGTSVGSVTAATYAFPGSALTASTIRFRVDEFSGVSIVSANWRVVWNPNAPGATNVGIRLIKCDDGPTNIEVLSEHLRNTTTSPVVHMVDVTAELQAVLAGGIWKHLGYQIKGDGSNSPLIFGSWIEVIWQLG